MSALSSTAVLPLVATPSIASHSEGGTCSRPDLAARFDEVYARWVNQREKERLELAACDQAQLDDVDFALSDDADLWSVINGEIADVVGAILAMPAASFADLALQARACALENAVDWTDSDTVESADGGAKAYRNLVDSIMGMMGGKSLPGVTVVPFANRPESATAL